MKIAFLGTGRLGNGFVRRLLDLGHTLHVWNRSPAAAKALEAHGAQAFASAAEAIAGVARVHLALADDDSVDAVLEPLAGVLPAPTWIIDHTTTAPTPTGERARAWASRGKTYLHAPVFMGPANAAEGTGIMLLCGDPQACRVVLADLETMTGKVMEMGSDPARAATFKLLGNLSLLGMTALAGDIVRLATAAGFEPAEAVAMFQIFNPGAMFPARAARVASGPFEPASFTTSMARKDVRLMIEEAARGGVELTVMPAVAKRYDEALATGEANLDCAAPFRWPLGGAGAATD
ncbi:MAG: NAD(P)-dependent oxidoreductase [Planctomycetota bacterium]|nr:MAG: NAD(P)-dependent oxidoreductase [Planctomycetota bacterium]